ncbi:SLBB domain-containing protein [Flavobacterium suzhouense]|uniref:SLBB domain-containing protein n=1 Tax=Flavobacterium suzhouense TaxID=1529638 RepID=A0ABW5NS49_9FLAO
MNKLIVFLFFWIFFISTPAIGQDLLKSNDLRSLHVDQLSDDQIAQIQSELKANNMSIDQAETIALSKGMPKSEFAKLRGRLAATKTAASTAGNAGNVVDRKITSVSEASQNSSNPMIFGSELFNNPALSFAPNDKIATPLNYILGPGDELQISLYGVQEFNSNAAVSVEGKISLPFVGQISVSGITIEAATQKIKNSMSKVYSTLASGQSKLSVSLGNIRTIRITIIGSKLPGNYSISSLSTVYNALYIAGGPSENGSYRNIELIRGNKVIKHIDIYRFLVGGDQSDNLGLKDNDVIRIPVYKNRVTIEGEVKRPGIFEIKEGETFADLISFASGFSEVAYTATVNVVSKTEKEFKVQDISSKDFSLYKPKSGDIFKVSKILNRFENRITIEGAVFRPNQFSFVNGMRISDLVNKADGLREDAYLKRAMLVRQKDDLSTEVVEVNLANAMAGDASANIELKKEDVLTIYSSLDFKENYNVSIEGEIKRAGVYPYFENLTLNDLIIQAGGLTGAASKKVEIARMIKSEDLDNTNPRKIELLNIEIDALNNEQAQNIELLPYDIVTIRRVAVFEQPEMVNVIGEVIYPGKYVLENKDERIADVIKRAGGLSPQANILGVKIRRPVKGDQIEDLSRVDLNLGKGDTIQKKLTDKVIQLRYTTIPVDWEMILKDEKHYSNVLLVPGDEIKVTAFDEGVKVSGNVLLNSEIPYRKGKSFKYYINSVGGIDNKGWKRKSYIIYPNGKADVTSSFLFFKSYPEVQPGSQIVVPAKPETKKMTTGEIVGIASVLTSLAGVVIAILTIK